MPLAIGPNDITYISCKEDLVRLGEDMKKVALDHPCMHPHEYLKDMKSLFEAAERMKQTYHQNRAIHILDHVVTIELTMDKFNGQNLWHMSMCEQVFHNDGRVTQTKIPDEPAKFISETMLGGKCEEIPHPGTLIPCIRHFTRNAE